MIAAAVGRLPAHPLQPSFLQVLAAAVPSLIFLLSQNLPFFCSLLLALLSFAPRTPGSLGRHVAGAFMKPSLPSLHLAGTEASSRPPGTPQPAHCISASYSHGRLPYPPPQGTVNSMRRTVLASVDHNTISGHSEVLVTSTVSPGPPPRSSLP
ncbi:hypothetical protein SKAU_G00289910 [Synaphobranchus kaupii]|uniref:Uncharacterized protein n=1 Tax=Synaphobranchus kaupii TaxID=118154 RepID=A0A9Q1ETM1_SYNKA|nr:hypothetical protein SKAU_G00289910 [Synaphobranchus kaupii]